MNFTAAVAWAISDLERHGVRLAAFLADSLFSSDGVLPDPAGFLAPVAEIVHAAGGLYIADEVQSGFARTGSHMWGYQRHGLAPDIVTMGKPMGNGLPIAGLVARQDVLDDFGRQARYFNTFGGNPVCVAAAIGRARRARGRGAARQRGRHRRVPQGRASPASRRSSPVLGDVRGAGLYLGVDVVSTRRPAAPSGELAAAIVNGMRERRVLISATGPAGQRAQDPAAAALRPRARRPVPRGPCPTSFPSRALRVSKDLREAASESRQLRLPAAPRPREIKARSPSPHAS